MSVYIEGRAIGLEHKPFIIAEMSANHHQSLEKALAIVEKVAQSGADAIKVQTLKPEGITLDVDSEDFMVLDKNNLWYGKTLFQLYQEAYLPWEWHKPIFEHAKKHGLIAFSTPFDLDAVDFLNDLNVPCFKIGSPENVDIPLIKKVAKTHKPIIISTGMASLLELSEAVEAARSVGNDNIILTKCVSSYPTDPKEMNLKTIPHMRELFGREVGLSDHTLGIGAAVASVAVGATVIEKHINLVEDESLDAAFSLLPNELCQLVKECNIAWESMGCVQYGPTETELISRRYRRSLYVTESVEKGTVLNEKNVRSIRPGFGLPTKFYDLILGRVAKKDLKKGQALSWDMVDL